MRRRLMALALLAACTTEPETARVVGLITAGNVATDVYDGPASVTAGQTFSATIFSYGSSSCTTPDGADVTVTGLIADVTPYDRVPTGNVVCTADFGARPHPITLRFPSAGAAELRVHGDGISIEGERLPIVVSVPIEVTP